MLKRGDKVGEITTGLIGKLADIQYEFDRYQIERTSGWRYGIENLKFMDFTLEEVKEHFLEVDRKAQETEQIITAVDLDMIDSLIEKVEQQEKRIELEKLIEQYEQALKDITQVGRIDLNNWSYKSEYHAKCMNIAREALGEN